MAHILFVEFPGGNDFGVMEDALAMGHKVSILSADIGHYLRLNSAAKDLLARAAHLIEAASFERAELLKILQPLHVASPIDAVICMVDICIVAAADLAAALGVAFLNPRSARLYRDKARVRAVLSAAGLAQPNFQAISHPDDLERALGEVGFPAIVKPSDGYGSQNILYLGGHEDVQAARERLALLIDAPTDYGLGIHAGGSFLVEPYLQGDLVGCDIFRDSKLSLCLGVNEKKMFDPPAFAIKGSCFPSQRVDIDAAIQFANLALDATGFDFGAAHIEMIITPKGPQLIEINPRLVSAQIPYQMSFALGRSVYMDLIDLHLRGDLSKRPVCAAQAFATTRWITASRNGVLERIGMPRSTPEHIMRIVMFKSSGDEVRTPFDNADRLGYVIATGSSEDEADRRAQAFVDAIDVEVRPSQESTLTC
ncbi:MAG: ATP-grasp domain-containing protein [Asticcacaulis sp.]|uniref:ATP-grasp domain-containing protein n=1 Tax=Asticcacaulis sp. TaxID=1872648 RepID=UPI003F7BD714